MKKKSEKLLTSSKNNQAVLFTTNKSPKNHNAEFLSQALRVVEMTRMSCYKKLWKQSEQQVKPQLHCFKDDSESVMLGPLVYWIFWKTKESSVPAKGLSHVKSTEYQEASRA